jgi:hypothetical protein
MQRKRQEKKDKCAASEEGIIKQEEEDKEECREGEKGEIGWKGNVERTKQQYIEGDEAFS